MWRPVVYCKAIVNKNDSIIHRVLYWKNRPGAARTRRARGPLIVGLLAGGLGCCSAWSAEPKGPFLAVLWPGLSIGYRAFNWAYEGRWQFMGGHADKGTGYNATLGSVRAARGVPLARTTRVYAGLEAGWFTYSTDDDFRTKGMTLGAYVGLEKFFKGPFSFAFDIGPYWAGTREIQGESGSEFDAVINAAVRWNFGREK
ncbi:MAG: hypothetical protein IPL30_02230 [Elusimicrobia bacterium]|nr:hypothetical protein [Elusimicrobiota bacterium]MBK8651268.1 hypothetical protein [Elusimicrobiota bacterium]MBL0360301.1 hypothetical protein [Elusimicrobiota bacterium]MBP8003452.1 hypothetical protein [Elusimicrobiota bacterium]